jgi:hypothetical protein
MRCKLCIAQLKKAQYTLDKALLHYVEERVLQSSLDNVKIEGAG